MLKVYGLLIILAVLGGVAYGAKYYYDTTQNTIATLQKNNATLKAAAETAEASIATLQSDMKKLSGLNKKLQEDLQQAEKYGDELRAKLNNLDLVVEALKNAKVLEGKMNGASAELWRGFMGDTGNPNKCDLPSWLQQNPTGAGSSDSNQSGESTGTSSSETKATTTQ